VKSELSREMRSALAAAVGRENLLTDPADRYPYGYDNSRRQALPEAVVFATSTEQVSAVVRACNAHGAPLLARGRGTGTAGGTVPLRGGVVLTLERMDRILAVDAANRIMRVEAGVTNQAVQDAAGEQGFFWPPDPTSAAYCSVGGNVAVNAAGPRAVKYGATRENVLGLTAVTGTGQIIHTGVYTTKSVVGYDLTRLIIGSEGTLAVVTEAILKLTPLPEARRTLRAVYRDIHSATEAVTAIMAQPIVPCALEFMDHASIEMVRGYSKAALPHDAGAMLMIEVDGPEAAMTAAVGAIDRAARNHGCLGFAVASSAEEVAALWATRKALSPALHAGNGNIHVNLLYDTQDPTQEENALPCISRVFDLVLALGGTLSGEHGIGVAKRDYMARAIEPATLALMRAIKKEFDPKGILNPGKVLPEA